MSLIVYGRGGGVFLGPEPSILSTCCTCNGALGGWEVLGLIFAGYVLLASQSPYPIVVYSVANFIDPIFGKICNFHNPDLVTFYFYELTHFFRFNEEHFAFHLQYKHTGMFSNRKYEELSYPKKSENVRPYSSNSIEICNPIIVNPVVKMRPHPAAYLH